jgi:hypothetical protein
MSEDTPHVSSNKPPLALIASVLVCYAVVLALGWPQQGAQLKAAHAHEAAETAGHEPALAHPPYWMVAPFAALLLAIAEKSGIACLVSSVTCSTASWCSCRCSWR